MSDEALIQESVETDDSIADSPSSEAEEGADSSVAPASTGDANEELEEFPCEPEVEPTPNKKSDDAENSSQSDSSMSSYPDPGFTTHVGGDANNSMFLGTAIFPKDPSPAKTTFESLLTDLPVQRKNDLPYVPSDILPVLEIKKRHLIIISCFADEVALAAAYSLIEEVFSSTKALYLGFFSERQNLDLDILSTANEGSDKARVVLAELKSSSPFLNSLVFCGEPEGYARLELNVLEQELERCKTSLICSLKSTVVKPNSDQLELSSVICHHHIDYLDYLLRYKYSCRDAAQVQVDLLEQQRQEKWPHQMSDFFTEVEELLRTERLLDELSRRKDDSIAVQRDDCCREAWLAAEPGLEHHLCLVAAFLPGLSPHSFRRTLEVTLAGETTEITEKKDVELEDGARELREEKTSRPLLLVWRESPDQALRKSRLKVCSAQQGRGQVVKFKDAGDRRGLKSYLSRKHPFLVARFFDKLEHILFERNLAENLLDRLIETLVDRSLEETENRCMDQLLDRTIRLTRQLESTPSQSGATPEEVKKKTERILRDRQEEWNFFADRLTALLQAMLSYPQLSEVIAGLFRGFMQYKKHLPLLSIVSRLRFAPNFEALDWLRQILDQGNEEARQGVEQVLTTGFSGMQAWRFLEGVHRWLPEPERDAQRYSHSQLAALRLAINYSQFSAKAVKTDHHGQWPSRYRLFRSLVPGSSQTEKQIDLLLGWLLHPDVDHAIERSRTMYLCAIASLIEQWVYILEGDHPTQQTHPEAHALTEQLLCSAARNSRRSERKTLLRFWYAGQTYHLQKANEAALGSSTRAKHRCQRSKLLEIRRRFAALAKDIRPRPEKTLRSGEPR